MTTKQTRYISRTKMEVLTAWILRNPGKILIVASLLIVIIILLMAVPDEKIFHASDSGSYLKITEMVLNLEPQAFVSSRAVFYPLIVAFHKISGISYYLTVSFFNLLCVTLYACCLFARGWKLSGTCSAAVGIVILFSAVNQGFMSSYLRESIILGVTALHLLFVLEALYSKRKTAYRLLLILAAILVLYHWKGMYLYVFSIIAPIWIYSILHDANKLSIPGNIACAILLTLSISILTWASNPNNDINRKNIGLIGVLLKSRITQYYAVHPEIIDDEAALEALQFMANLQKISNNIYSNPNTRKEYSLTASGINPIAIESVYQDKHNKSLWEQGTRIYIRLAVNDPVHFLRFVIGRSLLLIQRGFNQGIILEQYVGTRQGITKRVLLPLSWVSLYFTIGSFCILLFTMIKRKKGNSSVFMGAGFSLFSLILLFLIATASYLSFGRLFFPAFVYASLSFPLVVQCTYLKATNSSRNIFALEGRLV